MSDKCFLVDTSKCQGCRACQVACKQWNGLPGEKTSFFGGEELTNPAELSAITWNHVKFYPLDRSEPSRPLWTIMHKKCYHCEDANCLRVCPEKAISKQDGWVVIDQEKCIGCGACVNSCVYKVPHISSMDHTNDSGQKIVFKHKSHKCNACIQNPRDVPACVSTCPSDALLYGKRLTILNIAAERVKVLKKGYPNASIYGVNEFGGLKVITILRDKPSKYGLQENIKAIEMSAVESRKDIYTLASLFSMGIPSLKRMAYKIAVKISSSEEV